MDKLFTQGQHRTLRAYPVKAFFLLADEPSDVPVKMMVSVSKRHCFHDAVCRNRVKRQLREAYRKAKPDLIRHIAQNHQGKTLLIAFIWLGTELFPSQKIDRSIATLLQKIQKNTP